MEKSIDTARHWHLAELLRRLRQDAGLTQQDVARRLGRHHPFVHDYETGQRRLDVVRLREVAQALNTTLVEIVEELFNARSSKQDTHAPSHAVAGLRGADPYHDEWTRLCEHLRARRLSAGLTETEVAARLGEPQSFVSKYETKKRRLDLIELDQVTAAIDTPLIEFVAAFERGPRAQ